MLEKTKGIFLHYFPYSDSSVIARIYTEKYGQQSYLVQGVRSKKSGVRINLFQPLFLLDLEVFHKPGRNLQRMKNARIAFPFEQLPFHILKRSQALFVAEILMKCLKEEEPNPEMFDFIYHAACLLDLNEEGTANFLVTFLFKLTRYLGVAPRHPEPGSDRFFDLISGSFSAVEPSHGRFMDAELTKEFISLFQCDLSEIGKLPYRNKQRSDLLANLLEYYKIHLDLPGEMKSLSILKEVLG